MEVLNMMDLVLFGIGAAGNKAAIEVLERRILPKEKIHLVNTTVKDIPEQYKRDSGDLVIKFSSMLDGCGKESIKGKKAMYNAIRNKDIDFSSFIDMNTKAVILVTSVEGGTGCGATPEVAKYFMSLGVPTHVFALIGFQDDPRSINNSLKFFKELPDGIALHTIENNKFLDFNNNYASAEQAANGEFAEQVDTLLGSKMIPASQNIDDTDHYKILMCSGYMDIRHIDLSGVKNKDTCDQAIIDSFESMSCMEYTNEGCKVIAVIINASERTQNNIDDNFSVIRRYAGNPSREVFRHIQYDENEPEYMDIIIGGLPYPEAGIKYISKKYSEVAVKINNKSLSDIVDELDIDDFEETDMPKIKNPDDVLAQYQEVSSAKRADDINKY
jgi:cell division GTPase FtsZ